MDIQSLSYKSREFSYNVREANFGKEKKYYIYVSISCGGVAYVLSQKNDYKFGATSLLQAKKRIMKVLKDRCVGTHAEERMKSLPIFIDGYQERLF